MLFSAVLLLTGCTHFAASSSQAQISNVLIAEDAVTLAEKYDTDAKSDAAGNYGNNTIMNSLIDSLLKAETELTNQCKAIAAAENRSISPCATEVTEKLLTARQTITTMRDVDIESDIIILFGRYWRPQACLGGKSYGAPAYGSDKCFDVEQNVTIHGIWPSSSNRSLPNPVNCSSPLDLIQEDIDETGLEDDLHEHWISYYPIWPDNFQFWQWEWFKHGSCWDRTKEDFFEQALTWHNQFDVPAIMQDEDIKLNEMVNRDEVLQKMTSKMWGKRMGLLCLDNIYVDQIFSCWDYSGNNPIDCPPASQCKEEVMFRVYHDDTTSVSASKDNSSAARPGKSILQAFILSFLLAQLIHVYNQV